MLLERRWLLVGMPSGKCKRRHLGSPAEALEVRTIGKGYVMASRAPCRQYHQELFWWETKSQTRVDYSILGERVCLAS